MYIACMIITGLFAIIGFAAFIGGISSSVLRQSGRIMLLLPELSEINAEQMIRYAGDICEKNRLSGIICLCEPGSKTEEICRHMQKDYPAVIITDSFLKKRGSA